MGIDVFFLQLKELFTKEFELDVPVFLSQFGEIVIETRSENLYKVGKVLKQHTMFKFEQLIDLCGVDFFHYTKSNWATDGSVSDNGFSRGLQEMLKVEYSFQIRFITVYHLLSVVYNTRVTIHNSIFSSDLNVPSVVSLWESANWFEREVYDLFGISFINHPFLCRILTDYNFIGYPLRKDFPLIGYKELKYDDKLRKCVYVDVSIEQKVVNAKVVR